MRHIAIVNRSSRVTDLQARMMTHACAIQANSHVAAAWERSAINVALYHRETEAPNDAEMIVLLDAPDTPDALGYHTETSQGRVYGKVFVDPILANRGSILSGDLSVSTVLSHEVAEQMIDPDCNLWSDDGAGVLYSVEVCLTGDTKISLLNGTECRIEDLEGVDEFWVYGCSSDGNIVPARGHSARKTKIQAEIVEVLLDNGETIRCTPDHRFLLRDGSYRMASELLPETSLMPCYRQRAPLERSKLDYEQVWHPESKKWEFTHRLVAPACPAGSVRHHQDFNRFNNDPRNIRVMRADEHIELHGNYARTLWAEGRHGWQKPNPGKRARDSKRLTAYNKTEEHRAVARQSGSRNMQALWERPEFREHHVQRGRALALAYQQSEARIQGHAAYLADPERRAAVEAKNAEAARTPERREASRQNAVAVQARRTPEQKSHLGRFAMHVRWHQNQGRFQETCEFCPAPNNHKVVSVRSAGTADVWDITVDEVRNFALSAGVFVHNCDPVEGDSYQITVPYSGTPKISVSNFVFPSWFDRENPKKTKFDYLGKLTKPFTMTAGGYVIKLVDGVEKSVFAAGYPEWRLEGKKRNAARTFWRIRRSQGQLT